MQHLSNPKILAVLIVCASIVGSVWLLEQNSENSAIISSTLSSKPQKTEEISFPSNWVRVSDLSTSTATAESITYTGEGTLTDQLAKDFFSQYLITQKEKGEVTEQDADQIAQDTLAMQNYSKATGPQYTYINLHINTKADPATIAAYQNTLEQILAKWTPGQVDDVALITEKGVTTGKDSDLAKLDPIIKATKGLLSDALNMSVPSDAVDLHLAFVNALSNVLANTEALRQSLIDPVRSFAALSQYDQHTQDLAGALQNIQGYFQNK